MNEATSRYMKGGCGLEEQAVKGSRRSSVRGRHLVVRCSSLYNETGYPSTEVSILATNLTINKALAIDLGRHLDKVQ
jgi:hypothetical protein